MKTVEELILQLVETCKGAKNHLEACMAGQIRPGSHDSASYPLVMKALEDSKEFCEKMRCQKIAIEILVKEECNVCHDDFDTVVDLIRSGFKGYENYTYTELLGELLNQELMEVFHASCEVEK